ncbi:MAG: hypothetical protein HeimC3_31650 [Candidatus Heimdallarchaeota archaeon LC_3]|nr:MAG: hypothetical protein HeimC3_31650 [Candidatus Heimdallarchaeota archaeon LC_3]
MRGEIINRFLIYLSIIGVIFSLSANIYLVDETENNYQDYVIEIDNIVVRSKLLDDPVPSPHLTSRDPIWILNDQDFQDYGFPGNGSPKNPYVIENYMIIITTDSENNFDKACGPLAAC